MNLQKTPNTDGSVSYYNEDQHMEIQYTPMQNVLQDLVTGSIQPCEPGSTILKELRSLTKKFNKEAEATRKVITKLTEEVIALRTEVKQLKNLSVDTAVQNLPPLPFIILQEFKDFDSKLLLEDDLRTQVKSFLRKHGGREPAAFLRSAVKSEISDELAVNITWRGTNEKPGIQCFTTFTLIKDTCHSLFSNTTDAIINKIVQQHFLHARDRLHKKQNVTPHS